MARQLCVITLSGGDVAFDSGPMEDVVSWLARALSHRTHTDQWLRTPNGSVWWVDRPICGTWGVEGGEMG
jgi:hypothetical protein